MEKLMFPAGCSKIGRSPFYTLTIEDILDVMTKSEYKSAICPY